MKYEIVKLKEKPLVGITIHSSNDDLNLSEKIGELWTRVFTEQLNTSVKNIFNPMPICLYSGYTNKHEDSTQLDYDITVGFNASKSGNESYHNVIIPTGNYAKFEVIGDVKESVGKAWQEIWNMDLDRSYTGDFEEYMNEDMDNAIVHIYVALK